MPAEKEKTAGIKPTVLWSERGDSNTRHPAPKLFPEYPKKCCVAVNCGVFSTAESCPTLFCGGFPTANCLLVGRIVGKDSAYLKTNDEIAKRSAGVAPRRPFNIYNKKTETGNVQTDLLPVGSIGNPVSDIFILLQ